MYELDHQIQLCKACNGWSNLSQKKEELCPQCNGAGVVIKRKGETYYFGLPDFIDFAHRKKTKLVKTTVFSLIIIFVLVLIVIAILGILVLF